MKTPSVRGLAGKVGAALAGLVVALVLLEVGLRLGGMGYLQWQALENRRALEEGGSYTVLCIGESTTATGGDGSYPAQLQDVLNERRGEVAFTVINRGIPGATTDDILAELEHNLETYDPDMVVAMMGANDGDRGLARPSVPLADDGAAVEDLTGFPYSLKSYQLLRQLHHQRATASPTPDPDGNRPPLVETRDGGRAEAPGSAPFGPCEVGCEDDPVGCEVCTLVERSAKAVSRGEVEEAEALLREALEMRPGQAITWAKLGNLLTSMGRRDEALEAYASGVEVDPGNPRLGAEYGHALRIDGQYEGAVEQLGQVLAHQPGDPRVLEDMAASLEALGRTADAEAAYVEAVEASEYAFHPAVIRLAGLYHRQGRTADAEALITRALASPAADASFLRMVVTHHRRSGDDARADAVLDQLAALNGEGESSRTGRAFRRLQDTLRQRAIPLVAVQYPRQDVVLLRRLLDDPDAVVVVDNRQVFEQALADAPYEALFWDTCHGDFGHATRRGNRLLAENVADAILAYLD